MRKYILAGVALLVSSAASVSSSYASSLVAQIDLSTQTMTVTENGSVRYQWKVSTARRGYSTPVGSYSAKSLDIDHRSRKYHNSPMPYSVFFKGGYAVHGTNQRSVDYGKFYPPALLQDRPHAARGNALPLQRNPLLH